MKRTGLLLAVMLVIIVNLVALSGVRFNRTGAPEAVVTLTERELPVLPSEDDNSGIALRLSWRREDLEHWSADSWLDRAKLEELGFDCPPDDIDHDVNQFRKLFVVLEYRAEEVEPADASRLFAIDAGQDPAELRRLYPDRGRYIITSGVVHLRYREDAPADERLGGRVQQLLPPLIHVPKHHRALIADADSRYRVTLRYGRRHEPWILDVEPPAPAAE